MDWTILKQGRVWRYIVVAVLTTHAFMAVTIACCTLTIRLFAIPPGWAAAYVMITVTLTTIALCWPVTDRHGSRNPVGAHVALRVFHTIERWRS